MARKQRTPATHPNNPAEATPVAPQQAVQASPEPAAPSGYTVGTVGCTTSIAPPAKPQLGAGPGMPTIVCTLPPQFVGMAASTPRGKPTTPREPRQGGGNPGGGVQYLVLGHPVAAVLRYCGSRGLTPKQASAAVVAALGGTTGGVLPCSPHTVRTQVQRGKGIAAGKPGCGSLPTLSAEQVAALGL